MPVDINFMVGSEAGHGVQSVGFILAKAFARGGFHVFADQDYESRIRGGHNFFLVRVKDSQVAAIREPVDILLALKKESIDLHWEKITASGVITFDGEKIDNIDGNDNLFSVPLERLTEESTGGKLTTNTVSLGTASGLVGYDFEILAEVLQEQFGSGEIGQNNVNAARAGYEYTRQNFKGNFDYRLTPISNTKRMLLTRNETIANNDSIGDLSTLEDEASVEEVVRSYRELNKAEKGTE